MGQMSGPATRALMRRQYERFGDGRFERLAGLSNGHLYKLRIGELTKSRPRHCNDNALAESKNASVVRKHLGHGHIPRRFAPVVNEFTQRVLSPFLNYHHPCLFPTDTLDDKGRVTKRYRDHDVMTPDRESLDPGLFIPYTEHRRMAPQLADLKLVFRPGITRSNFPYCDNLNL